MKKFSMTITTVRYHLTFVAHLHVLSSHEQFHLDPEEFYLKWGKSIPIGIHHEIEIVEPGEVMFRRYPLHISRSRKTGIPFVCYPLYIPTLEKAYDIFKVWCVGTMLTISEGVDLNTVYTSEYTTDSAKFFQAMQDKYNVRVTWEGVSEIDG